MPARHTPARPPARPLRCSYISLGLPAVNTEMAGDTIFVVFPTGSSETGGLALIFVLPANTLALGIA